MSTSNSNQESSSFYLLDKRIQRWIWEAGWDELKDIQERAIPLILESKKDIIIAAATATGKTEAAFMPILTQLLRQDHHACVIYISPLKALINDQWGRLTSLCENLEIPVIPWHGDISSTQKKSFLKDSQGCLLITPESLEAFLMTRGHALSGLFNGLMYLVVDELHSFIGTERGKQLQSLMHRIDVCLKRKVPRIALSATLGDMNLAAEFLRPCSGEQAEIVRSEENHQELKVIVKGYMIREPKLEGNEEVNSGDIKSDETALQGELAISEHLYKNLRGENNLIFPNSRAMVETYSDLLRRYCERDGLPNEFWPHHGNLAKEIREETERALKSSERPTTAICTTTLELGIDIGIVKSVAQIGPSPSVASMRQRLGRSGRRKGEPAVLRSYVLEAEISSKSGISDQLRESLIQSIAQIRLLVDGWYEPPQIGGMHLSTMIQQLLSLIVQYGGITVSDARHILCNLGPFHIVNKQDFVMLLRALGSKDVLTQTENGLLLHGGLGERLVNHYSFYAAFTSDEEFRVVCGGKPLGTLPLSQPIEPGSYIIFAGRRWQVELLDSEKKIILVVPAKGGKVPIFEGSNGLVGDRVREEMRKILAETISVPFLDKIASNLLNEARDYFNRMNLDKEKVIDIGRSTLLFFWKGDQVMNTLALMLKYKGLDAINEGLFISINNVTKSKLLDAISNLLSDNPIPAESLVTNVMNKQQEKWDWLLPDELLCRNYASLNLNVPEAYRTIQSSTFLEKLIG